MKSWILTSTLPHEIRMLPDILDMDDENDAIYQGMVSAIVSLIYLNNGILPEGISAHKLELMGRVI